MYATGGHTQALADCPSRLRSATPILSLSAAPLLVSATPSSVWRTEFVWPELVSLIISKNMSFKRRFW